MRILVTGGSGFLGSHIIDHLTSLGHDVVSYDIVKSKFLNENSSEIIGDLSDNIKLNQALKNTDIVFHLGASPDIHFSESNPVKTIEINTIGTCNVIEAAITNNVKKIIFASSIYVNSDKGSFYRISKQTCENIIFEYNRLHKINYTILRFGTLWGPRSDERNAIYSLLKQAATSNQIDVSGSGNELREYIHIKDAAEISAKMLDEDTDKQIYILTGHHQTKLTDLVETIKEISGKDLKINYQGDTESHYIRTPYSFIDKEGKKIVLNTYQDMGSGLLSLFTQIKKNYLNN